MSSDDLEGLAYRLKFVGFLALEFTSNFFEPGHILTRVQALAAMQAYLSRYAQNRGVIAPAEELLDLLLDQLAAANRALRKGHHRGLFLSRQFVQRSGSGR